MPEVTAGPGVRRMRDADYEGWLVLWRGYLSFYRAEVTDEVTRLSFARLCAGTDGMLGLVAVDGEDRPVGLAHLIFHAATWSATDYCYLEDLYVDPVRRGGSVARALFDAVYATARERGVPRAYWHTQQYNGPARSLYDQVGQPTSFVVYEHDLA
ncbi:MAG TPA: GNAT family N-acetyltransferase [Solirubrobacteraceae bacterium]|jgi:GNAT superfamily N-acetyltransferase